MIFKHEPTGYYVEAESPLKAKYILQKEVRKDFHSIDFKRVESVPFMSISKFINRRRSN
jgi:hypothetical protein